MTICRESECELRVQSGTRIIDLLVSCDSEVRYRACGKLRRTFGIGTLAARPRSATKNARRYDHPADPLDVACDLQLLRAVCGRLLPGAEGHAPLQLRPGRDH